MKTILCALLIYSSFLSGPAYAQEQPDKLRRANELFEQYEYFRSAGLYRELAAKKNPGVFVLERLALCYLRMNEYTEAEKWYEKLALKTEGRFALDYARVLVINQKFTAAKEQFRKYYNSQGVANELAAKLALCDSAALWMSHPANFVVQNHPANSSFSEWGATYYGQSLVVASDRLRSNFQAGNRYPWTNNGFLKLYETQPSGQVSQLAFNDPIFRVNQHIGPAVFSATGDTVYLTVSTAVPAEFIPPGRSEFSERRLITRRLELVSAIKRNGRWTAFRPFVHNNAAAWSVGHAALSPDGNTLYFVSDRPGGQGSTDIWYCQRQAGGSWGRAVNCGNTINTKEEEEFPVFGNGKLFFASKGLPGMGGYDIFEATGSDASWSVPVNLRYPVNSTSDDFWLATRDGSTGYFSSNRPGGKGNDDLYTFLKVAGRDAPLAVEPKPASPNRDTVFPPASAALVPGASFVLNAIYYDLDKWDIRADAAIELDKLLALLKENPSVRIELSSHTDSRAPEEYNDRLSQKRAESAVRYLVERGISPERLVARGYGERQLVNGCTGDTTCSEEAHQLNRRTEIKIIK